MLIRCRESWPWSRDTCFFAPDLVNPTELIAHWVRSGRVPFACPGITQHHSPQIVLMHKELGPLRFCPRTSWERISREAGVFRVGIGLSGRFGQRWKWRLRRCPGWCGISARIRQKRRLSHFLFGNVNTAGDKHSVCRPSALCPPMPVIVRTGAVLMKQLHFRRSPGGTALHSP